MTVVFISIRTRPSALECLDYMWFQVPKGLKDLCLLCWFIALKTQKKRYLVLLLQTE